MERITINKGGNTGVWLLSDSEMLRFSIYATETAKQFKKQRPKAKGLYREAKETAEQIDSILEKTEYYQKLADALNSIKI